MSERVLIMGEGGTMEWVPVEHFASVIAMFNKPKEPAPPVAERGEWTDVAPSEPGWYWMRSTLTLRDRAPAITDPFVGLGYAIGKSIRWRTARDNVLENRPGYLTYEWWSLPIVPPLTPDASSKP